MGRELLEAKTADLSDPVTCSVAKVRDDLGKSEPINTRSWQRLEAYELTLFLVEAPPFPAHKDAGDE
jgi:hypothetical protein